jgi:glyoxylase-like metal-dependent hydrolase (beta-lactamase superfamily II)
VVESFQTPEGARWIAEKARELTGRWPTHVLVTHYHGDHSGGVEGFQLPESQDDTAAGVAQSPDLYVTSATQDLKRNGFREDTPISVRRLWADVVTVAEEAPSNLDLGGRTVHLVPRRGHTASDVTVELPEEGITWCGDLVWNGMFPNYMDAVPSQLSGAVRALQADRRALWVPGHGPLAGEADLARYLAVIDGIEETARTARREGWTAQEAGERHRIPDDLGEWTLFNPSYFQRAVEAWMKEWG